MQYSAYSSRWHEWKRTGHDDVASTTSTGPEGAAYMHMRMCTNGNQTLHTVGEAWPAMRSPAIWSFQAEGKGRGKSGRGSGLSYYEFQMPEPRRPPEAQDDRDTLDPGQLGVLRNEALHVRSGALIKIQEESWLTDSDLHHMLEAVVASHTFRPFAGRALQDFKLLGVETVELEPPWDVLNPLLRVMAALALKTMQSGEELALIQLIVNLYQDGGDSVKPHSHRCRQLCASLGASRRLEVKGEQVVMHHGDVLPLAGETHAVPPSEAVRSPRVSVCLFYGSKRQYAEETISVNALQNKYGESFWFEHPSDLPEGSAPRQRIRNRGRREKAMLHAPLNHANGRMC